MKKFLVIYKAPIAEFERMMAASAPEDQEKGMDEWRVWMAKHKDGVVDEGAPVGKTKQVMRSGITDIKNDIGGYGIVQAADHQAAAELVKDSPHLTQMDGSIEVMEIVGM